MGTSRIYMQLYQFAKKTDKKEWLETITRCLGYLGWNLADKAEQLFIPVLWISLLTRVSWGSWTAGPVGATVRAKRALTATPNSSHGRNVQPGADQPKLHQGWFLIWGEGIQLPSQTEVISVCPKPMKFEEPNSNAATTLSTTPAAYQRGSARFLSGLSNFTPTLYLQLGHMTGLIYKVIPSHSYLSCNLKPFAKIRS